MQHDAFKRSGRLHNVPDDFCIAHELDAQAQAMATRVSSAQRVHIQ
jgi:hypothetical protein